MRGDDKSKAMTRASFGLTSITNQTCCSQLNALPFPSRYWFCQSLYSQFNLVYALCSTRRRVERGEEQKASLTMEHSFTSPRNIGTSMER